MRRRVKVWQTECGHWAWCCTFCKPARHGQTVDWRKTLRSVRNHFKHVSGHHAWVARTS
jgi:hypothetical protein